MDFYFMRFWFSGPRISGLRPGISLSASDFAARDPKTSQKPAGERISGSFLYVIRGDHNMSKIGVTTNPTARIASLRTGSAFPLAFSFLGCTPGTGYDIEREAKAILASHACNGEWFDLSPELAASAILGAAAKLGQPMQCVDELTAQTILKIAGQAPAPPPRPPMTFLQMVGIVILTVVYYIPLMIIAAIATNGINDSAWIMTCAALIAISLYLAYKSVVRTSK